jgi:hypothetical protein
MRLHEGAIDVALLHHCVLELADPAHRDLVLACGAALAELRLSLRQLGYVESVVTFPDDARADLLARVSLDDHVDPEPEAYVLYQALRGPNLVDDGAVQALDESLLAEIKAVCEQERAHLHYVDRSILAAEERARDVVVEPPPDVLCEVADVGEAIALLHPFQLRTFRPDTDAWTNGYELALSAPVAALLTTPNDTPADWLAAGQAITRALLRARVEGVHAQVHGVATPAIREELARDLGGEAPQAVVRFGYPRANKLARHETRMFEAVRA